jgi:Tfp pilus assembly protein PilZ
MIGNQSLRCFANILGGGGLLLTQVADLAPGDQLSVSFRPAKHLPVIQAKVVVLHKMDSGTAVEFTEITSEDRHLLLRFIHRKTGDRKILDRAPLATQIQSGQSLSLAFSRDLSLGGIFIETKEPLPVGSLLVVRFNLNGNDKVVVTTARVAYHVEKMGMGVLFSELAPGHRADIEEYVESHPDQFPNSSPSSCLDPWVLLGQQNAACGLGLPA